MSELITITTPLREFKAHEGHISAVAVFPDKRRMVTGSHDKTLRLWDLKTGVVLKKMEGHRNPVLALAVSQDGQLITSSDCDGEVIVGFFSRWNSPGHWFILQQNDESVEYQNLAAARRSNRVW